MVRREGKVARNGKRKHPEGIEEMELGTVQVTPGVSKDIEELTRAKWSTHKKLQNSKSTQKLHAYDF